MEMNKSVLIRSYSISRSLLGVLLILCSCASSPQTERKVKPSFVQAVIDLTNRARVRHAAPPVRLDLQLTQAAVAHSQAMAADHFLNHRNPTTSSTPGDRAQAAGYAWQRIGENIAAGARTPAQVVAGWLRSPTHRAALLDPTFQDIGVGYVAGTATGWECVSRPCQHYWTQLLGRRGEGAKQKVSAAKKTSLTSKTTLRLFTPPEN